MVNWLVRGISLVKAVVITLARSKTLTDELIMLTYLADN